MNPMISFTLLLCGASVLNGAPSGNYVAPAVALAPAISLPAPFATKHVQGEAKLSVHQPPAQITKQLHYADRPYVAGYATTILKPAIPDFRIQVPTVLKHTERVNAPVVAAVVKEEHRVDEPYPVERPYNVPYDVVKTVEKVVEVPTPVHVAKPYAVPQPYAVAGEPIIQVSQGAPIVKHTHHHQRQAYLAHQQVALPAALPHLHGAAGGYYAQPQPIAVAATGPVQTYKVAAEDDSLAVE